MSDNNKDNDKKTETKTENGVDEEKKDADVKEKEASKETSEKSKKAESKDETTKSNDNKPEDIKEDKDDSAKKDTKVTSDGSKTTVKLEDESKKVKGAVGADKDVPAIDAGDVQLQAPMATQEDNGTGSKPTASPSMESKEETTVAIKPDNKTAATAPSSDKGALASDWGLNSRLLFAISTIAFGSAFQHGFNLGVLNAPQKLIEQWTNETSYNRTGEYLTETSQTMIFSWIVSIYAIGGMIGGGATGFFSERFGRKGGLLINNVFAFIAAILMGFCKMANSWEMIIAGRFFIGINNGLNAGLAPMYLTEIAPNSLRGAIGTVYQLFVTISILFSQVMGMDVILGTEDLWPILLALTAAPAIFQVFTLPICPESPKYILINKGKQIEAQRALTWFRGTSNVHDEMEEMSNEAESQKLVPAISLREIITNPVLRIPLIISVMMMVAQQFSGINAVIFFSKDIYESAGLSEEAAMYSTIAMGAMNVLMTFVSLVLVERAGRKTLMLVGLCGMLIDSLLLTICLATKDYAQWISYSSIILVILFVVMFATGPGSIPWFLVNEVFASNARPIAASIAVGVNWTCAFLVGLCFLPIAQALGPYVFLVFVVLLALFILFTWKKVPETKGRSIDEVTAIFKQQAYGTGNSV